MMVNLSKLQHELEQRRNHIYHEVKEVDKRIAAIDLVLDMMKEQELKWKKKHVPLRLWYPLGRYHNESN
jgi:hypothetical protein